MGFTDTLFIYLQKLLCQMQMILFVKTVLTDVRRTCHVACRTMQGLPLENTQIFPVLGLCDYYMLQILLANINSDNSISRNWCD